MIKSFRHKGLERFSRTGGKAGINPVHAGTIGDVLTALEAAERVTDLGAPGFRLHELKGAQKGRWSVRVSGAWRITFGFTEGSAIDVDYEQYH